jgi:hypothetical protein
MKKIIVLFLFVFSFGALVPSFAFADIPPFPSPNPTPQCSNLYWIDNTNKTCESPKQFCGAYAYLGLQTFNFQEECLNTVNRRTSFDFGTTTLRNGSHGEAVKELQRFLNQSVNWGLVIDGKLGPKTINVIKTWQRDNGLTPDGLVGSKTKAKMNESVQ